MPTGYTAGIIDGKITTFEEFATVCTRAFGATIHMRDESLETPYEPRTPSEFYVNSLQSLRENLERVKSMSDDDIVLEFEEKIQDEINYHSREIASSTIKIDRLNAILEGVRSWIPPSEDHESFKAFMNEQIEITIKSELGPSYHMKKVETLRKDIQKGVDPAEKKNEMILDLEQRIADKCRNLELEIERCKKSNEWMDAFFRSIR
jgi:hypothetical protein